LNDEESKVADLKRMVRKFVEERDWDQFHNAKDLAIGIVTEASELLEIFRFKSNTESEALLHDELSAKNVRHELADIFYFALRFAEKYEMDVSQSLQDKLRENEKRYPIEKSKGSNRKYSELGR
jgi:NTP pyrophosphatase (non-canonical NTP hydrolase)